MSEPEWEFNSTNPILGPFYQALSWEAGTPSTSMWLYCHWLQWDIRTRQKLPISGACFILGPIPSVPFRIRFFLARGGQACHDPSFLISHLLDLSPFPRTLVLKAIHIDLCEQPGPADWRAGHDPRLGPRTGKEYLAGWGVGIWTQWSWEDRKLHKVDVHPGQALWCHLYQLSCQTVWLDTWA